MHPQIFEPFAFIFLSYLLAFGAHSFVDIPTYIQEHGLILLSNDTEHNRYRGHMVLFYNETYRNVCTVACTYAHVHPLFIMEKIVNPKLEINLPHGYNSTLGKLYLSKGKIRLWKLIPTF